MMSFLYLSFHLQLVALGVIDVARLPAVLSQPTVEIAVTRTAVHWEFGIPNLVAFYLIFMLGWDSFSQDIMVETDAGSHKHTPTKKCPL